MKGHNEIMEHEICEKVSWNEIKVPRKRRPLERRRDVVEEYMCYKGVRRRGELQQAKSECLDRES